MSKWLCTRTLAGHASPPTAWARFQNAVTVGAWLMTLCLKHEVVSHAPTVTVFWNRVGHAPSGGRCRVHTHKQPGPPGQFAGVKHEVADRVPCAQCPQDIAAPPTSFYLEAAAASVTGQPAHCTAPGSMRAWPAWPVQPAAPHRTAEPACVGAWRARAHARGTTRTQVAETVPRTAPARPLVT